MASNVLRSADDSHHSEIKLPFILTHQLSPNNDEDDAIGREDTTVHKGVEPTSGKVIAIKISEAYPALIEHEFKLLQENKHPNIVEVYNSFRTADGQTGIIMEYCGLGSLWDQAMLTYMREFAIWRYTFELVSGVAFLHARDLVHRNLRASKVLVTMSSQVKICDLSLAMEEGLLGYCLNSPAAIPYFAPELLSLLDEEVVARKEHDIWALGVIVFVLATRHLPWHRADRSDVRYRAFCCRNYSNKPWTTFSHNAIRFFEQVFLPLEERPTIEDVQAMIGFNIYKPEPVLKRKRETESGISSHARGDLRLRPPVDVSHQRHHCSAPVFPVQQHASENKDAEGSMPACVKKKPTIEAGDALWSGVMLATSIDDAATAMKKCSVRTEDELKTTEL